MPDLKPTKDLVNAAIEVADEFPVFPCGQNKVPVCSGGFKAATQDHDEIQRLFSIKGAALIGIPTGEASGLSVIDIDVRDGKQGLEWEKANAELLGLTKKAKTQSGGRHYYYNHEDGIRNRKGIDGCVDIRGDGGYVIHPASDGYEWLNDEDFADFPSDFAASSQAPAPAVPETLDIWGKLTDGREAKMAEMVYAKCADAVREVGFDKAYEKVIAEYPDYERLVVARGESLEADGRGLSEWKKKTRSTLAKFEREGAPEPRSTISCGLPLEQIGFIDPAQLPKRKIIYGLDYIEGTISMTVAAGGVGKSTAIIFEACSIANNGHNVMLLMLEDEPNEVRRRVKACVMHHSFDEGKVGANLVILNQEQRLTMAAVDNKQAVAVDYDKLRDAIKSFGTRVLIVDPFVQTHQMNENDNQQINFVADLFRSIAKECHIAVMLVHHTRKGAEFGARGENARGASALKDAARNVRELRLPTPNDVKDLNIEPTKANELIIVDHTKANYTRLADLRFFRKVIIEVKCGLVETETVATVEPYDLAAHTIQISDEHYDTALQAIALKQDGELAYVRNPRPKSLNIYKDLAYVTGLTRNSCEKVIDDLFESGKIRERKHNRQGKALYVVSSQ